MTANKRVTGPEDDEAANVRHLAVRAIKLNDPGMIPLDLREALVIAKHLRAGRVPEAILVHGVVMDQIRKELSQIGQVEETHADLVNHLAAFLEVEGYEFWRHGRWSPDPDATASSPHLRVTAAS